MQWQRRELYISNDFADYTELLLSQMNQMIIRSNIDMCFSLVYSKWVSNIDYAGLFFGRHLAALQQTSARLGTFGSWFAFISGDGSIALNVNEWACFLLFVHCHLVFLGNEELNV